MFFFFNSRLAVCGKVLIGANDLVRLQLAQIDVILLCVSVSLEAWSSLKEWISWRFPAFDEGLQLLLAFHFWVNVHAPPNQFIKSNRNFCYYSVVTKRIFNEEKVWSHILV